MSTIKGAYELSIWRDVYNSNSKKFEEEKIVTIGSDKMQDASVPHRAYDISQKRNVNGTRNLSFKLSYTYIDTTTGEKVANPFVGMLTNETKIKLKHKGKWYDYLIKNIAEDSKSHTCTYSAEDLFVNELSKNGFGAVLDREKENNIGTNEELAKRILEEDTDWRVEGSDVNVQTQVETLYLLSVSHGTNMGYNLPDPENEQGVGEPESAGTFYSSSEDPAYVLAFYSSCSGKPRRFQYIHIPGKGNQHNGIYATGEGEYVLDADNYIINDNCQYFIDMEELTYEEYKPANESTGIYLPNGFSFVKIITKYQAKRYVFSQKTAYYAPLDIYVDVVKKADSDKEYYHYKKSEYFAPTFITNLISNNNFTEKSGWTGNCFHNTNDPEAMPKDMDAKVEAKTDPDLYAEFGTGNFTSATYTPYLKIQAPPFDGTTYDEKYVPMVVEDSFHSNRTKIENLTDGDQYVFAWRLKGEEEANQTKLFEQVESIDVAEWDHDTDLSCYKKGNKLPLMNINKDNEILTKTIKFETYTGNYNEDGTPEKEAKEIEYFYTIATVDNSTFTESTFKKSKVRTFFTLKRGAELGILDFQIFKYTPRDGTDEPIFPDEQSTEGVVKTFHYYFDKDENLEPSSLEDLKLLTSKEEESSEYKTVIDNKCEKIREVSAKESNYFNILQNIAEKFECWLDIDVEHDESGKVTDKKIRFKNYVGKKLPYGFRYGFNLQAVQRTNVSKALTTKLIVRQNSNELAENGFCTIARAYTNPTGDTSLYDFSYYFKQGLMNEEDFIADVYAIPNGYYNKIQKYNKELVSLNDELAQILPQLVTIGAEKQVAEDGMKSANEVYEQAEYLFNELADFALTDTITDGADKNAKLETIKNSTDLNKYYTEAVTALQSKKLHTENYDRLKVAYDNLESQKNALTTSIKNITDSKKEANKQFYSTYHRFIQEGTWQSEEYVDDEKYYLDAQKTLYNSCWPQVTYSIGVANLENHPDYQYYKFELGDTTYIQDPEFFGYMNDSKTPYRKEIVISEKTEYIDCPWKDTLSVQTFKNQFQDLFKSLTASVQSLQYSEGMYQKAAELAVSDEKDRLKFLESAMNSAEMTIKNAGDQSVTWGDEGLIVQDKTDNSKWLRLTSGAIMFRNLDEKSGNEIWKTGITADGISANMITTGQLDTKTIQIKNGHDTSFRWDSEGITAYSLDNEKKYVKNKGVRFNNKGLLGFSGVDTDKNEVTKDNASFYFTEDGMRVQPSNFGSEHNVINGDKYVKIGKVNDNIYRSWNSNGLPSTTGDGKPFVTVMEVGDQGSGQFTIYSDGTVTANNIKFTGSVGWTAAASPSLTVFARKTSDGGVPNKPANGTLYNKFADTHNNATGNYVENWHKIYEDGEDMYKSETSDGGNTWSQVFLIQGEKGEDGLSVRCYVESSQGQFIKDSIGGATPVTFTARIFVNGEELTSDEYSKLTYTWKYGDATKEVAGEHTITLPVTKVRNMAISFTAEEVATS